MLLARNAPKWHEWKVSAMVSRLQVYYTIGAKVYIPVTLGTEYTDGIILEKNQIFQSSKRPGSGIVIQSIRHIVEKNGGASSFTHENGIFSAKVMLRL